MRRPDVLIENHGTIITVEPLTAKARAWINGNVSAEPWQWLGARLAVDPRCVEGLAGGLDEAGFRVSGRL